MDIKPYIKVRGERSWNGEFVTVNIDYIAVSFTVRNKNEEPIARSVYFNGYNFDALLSANDQLVAIESLKAKTLSEFWLKVYTAGCVFDGEYSAPTEPEMEICRLKDEIADLKMRIQKYKDTMKLMYGASEKI